MAECTYVAAVDALEAVHFQLGVILACRLPVSTFLPVVAVLAILDATAVVQQHRSARRSARKHQHTSVTSGINNMKQQQNRELKPSDHGMPLYLFTTEVFCQASC